MGLKEKQELEINIALFKALAVLTVFTIIGSPIFFVFWFIVFRVLIHIFGTGEYYPTGYGLEQ